jgi:leucyl aminopeptidase
MPLKINVRSVLPAREAGDVIVVGVPTLGGSKKKNARSPLDGFDQALGGALGRVMKKDEFKGKKDQTLSLAMLSARVKADRLVVMGLGDVAKLGPADVRTFAAKAARAANADKAFRKSSKDASARSSKASSSARIASPST